MTGSLSDVSDSQSHESFAPFVVAIDGPSGSGKTSTSREVASRLGLAYLDTGAMYRAATWLATQSDVAAQDLKLVAKLVAGAEFGIGTDPRAPQFLVNGTDVTSDIRAPRISEAVSGVASNREVRRLLIAQQRQLIQASGQGIVVEGRDITTVVAPDAPLRVLLVADSAARAQRRTSELGHSDQQSVHDQMLRRDSHDATVSEFTEAAPGVVVIDSTDQTLDQVAGRICDLAEHLRAGRPAPSVAETNDPSHR